ncbi:hypothetical protein HK104_006316, partial [Borealophlyctis nickersoniae]
MLRNCPRLVALVLDDCIDLTDACFVEGIAKHPNLSGMKELSLARCCEVTDVGLLAALGESEGRMSGTTAPSLRSLKTLNITCVPLLTERALLAVAKVCTHLEELKAADSDAVTDVSLLEIANRCRGLTGLDVSECMMLTDKGLIEFQHIRMRMWELAAGVGHLTSLKLNRSPLEAVTDKTIMALLPLPPKHKRQGRGAPLEMRNLELSFARNITPVSFAHVATSRPSQLHSLDLSNISLVHPDAVQGLADLIKAQPLLNRLMLAGSPSLVTDATCECISQSLPNLLSLDMSECGQVTDAGVAAIARGCPSLEEVNLKGCTQLTDITVKAFVHNGLNIHASFTATTSSKLRSINLGLITNLTDASLHDLSHLFARRNTAKMHTLKLSGCLNITDAGLAHICDAIAVSTHPSTTTTTTFQPKPDPLRLLCLS